MNFIGIDLEGVLVPEIWVALAKSTGIEELKLTTKDISKYKELMEKRISVLNKNHIKADLLFKIAPFHLLGLKALMGVKAKTSALIGRIGPCADKL